MNKFIISTLHACYKRQLALRGSYAKEYVNSLTLLCDVQDTARFPDRCSIQIPHCSVIQAHKYKFTRTNCSRLSKVAVNAFGKMAQMTTLNAINILKLLKRSQSKHVSDIKFSGTPFTCLHQGEGRQSGPGMNARTTDITKRVAYVFDRESERVNQSCLMKNTELFIV